MTNPFDTFASWFQDAKIHPLIIDHTAVNLATSSKNGRPSNRMVLLKDFSEKGFVFYTNLQSHKGQQLLENPFAAMCFYWPILNRQIRIEGSITPVSPNEADTYFASRHLQSQIGAWASKQSQILDSTSTLTKAIASHTAKFLGKSIPRPPHWSGFLLAPDTIEFWEEGAFRIHKRLRYTKNNQNLWTSHTLYP